MTTTSSFSLSVSSGFGNQFFNLSSDKSTVGNFKDTTDAEINSSLDVQIQQEIPYIQSSSILNVHVLVISKSAVLSPIPKIPTVTLTTTPPPPHYVSAISHRHSKPSHRAIEYHRAPAGNNVAPSIDQHTPGWCKRMLISQTLVQDPNQHLKDFLKLVDSLDLDGENRERTRLRLFQFSLRDQASNWLERLPTGSITTWEDLTTRFLA
ncbi:zinc finger, CCHC-type containing protein [Tanacetum coccineum]